MPDTYQVRITPRVLSNLEAIFDYISKDSPGNAAKMISRLLAAMDSLEMMPHRYRVIGRTRNREIRSMTVSPYLIRFRIEETNRMVRILQVRHGARG